MNIRAKSTEEKLDALEKKGIKSINEKVEPLQTASYVLPKSLMREFKIIAAKQGRTQKEIVREILENFIASENGKN